MDSSASGGSQGARRRATILLSLLAACTCRAAERGVIDFRNFIPGVLDAPAYHVDGTNRLSGLGYMAALYVARPGHESALAPVGTSLSFGTGDRAGYVETWEPPRPNPVTLPFAAGEEIWVQVRAWELSRFVRNYDTIPPHRLLGNSATLTLVVSNTPTPLLGLKSFTLSPAPIRHIWRQRGDSGDELVLRWSAGDGTVHYAVDVNSEVSRSDSWRTLADEPSLIVMRDSSAHWYADWVLTNRPSGTESFYRLRLLPPYRLTP